MAMNCLYRGSGTLLLNLLQAVPTFKVYRDTWHAQYADGAINSIFEVAVNPIFVGFKFPLLSYYLYREFQVILIGINHQISEKDLSYHTVLNPGSAYLIRNTDHLFFIAASSSDLDEIINLTQYEYENSIHELDFCGYSSPDNITRPTSEFISPIDLEFYMKKSDGEYVEAYPKSHMQPAQDHKCLLRATPHEKLEDIIIDSADSLKGHILVCTMTYNILPFISALRSVHLISGEFKKILILAPVRPTSEEFENISIYPEIYILIGDPQKRLNLEKASILAADKIVLMRMNACSNNYGTNDKGMADSSSILVSHIIFDIFRRANMRVSTIFDLEYQNNIKFLRHTDKKSSNHHNRSKKFIDSKMEVLNHPFYAPSFASGGAICSRMLENILFQQYHQPSIAAVIEAFCGVTGHIHSSKAKITKLKTAKIFCINVPDEYVNRSCEVVYLSLATHSGIIMIGILREGVSASLGNILPFVITNPLPSLIIRKTDVLYVLATPEQLR
jgi:hypothetical protein